MGNRRCRNGTQRIMQTGAIEGITEAFQNAVNSVLLLQQTTTEHFLA
jgi:hypothetical protein